MDKLYDPVNIRRFCDSLVRAVGNNDQRNVDNLLLVLKILVNGPPGERCQSFYNLRMPPDKCIAAVLRAKCTQDALRVDTERCERLVTMLLDLPYLTDHLCRAMSTLVTCLSPSSVVMKTIPTRIFKHEDLYKFDLRTIRRCLEQDTSELEITMIKLCTQDVDNDDFLKLFDHWIRWCSQSPDVFQIVTGIFNELLRLLKCKRRVIGVVGMFVRELRKTCEVNGIDLVSLYPCDAQNLVFLLLIDCKALKMEDDEGFRAILTEIRKEFSNIRKINPHMALLLFTHFPEWNTFLERYWSSQDL